MTAPLLPVARRFLTRHAPYDDVDDMVQDVALRIHARAADDPIANPEAYVLRVAHSVLADRARRDKVRHRAHHRPLDDHDHPIDHRSPERVLLGKENLQQLVAAVLALPGRTQEAFVLHRFEQMSYLAIALRMGISVSAVEKHVTRAIRLLTTAID